MADASQLPRLSRVSELSGGGGTKSKEMKVSWHPPSLHKILTMMSIDRSPLCASRLQPPRTCLEFQNTKIFMEQKTD